MPQRAKSSLTKHTVSFFAAGAVHTRNASCVVGNWTVREREKCFLRVAVALHDELKLLVPGCAALFNDNLGLRSNRVPDLGPNLPRGLSQCPRMALAQNGNVRVVIEVGELLAPPNEHLIARVQ